MKKVLLLILAGVVLNGCASSNIKVAEAKNVKKVAIVGFTLDYSMSFKENAMSTLKGEQRNEGGAGGMGLISGAFAKSEPLADYSYRAARKSLMKSGWNVLSYKNTIKSKSLNQYLNKRTKKGYFPITKGRKRIAATGIPAHYYMEGLKKSPILDQIAKELGVDALLFVYSNTQKKCLGALGNCINTPKYFSQVMVTAYDAKSDERIAVIHKSGPKVKKQEKTGQYKLNQLKTAMLLANSKAFDLVGEELNSKIK